MAVRTKEITKLRDIERDLETYINQYTDEIVDEYVQSWSHEGWGIGRAQIDKLRRHVKAKISSRLVLRIDFNYPEFNQIVEMTPKDIAKAKELEKSKNKGCVNY